MRALPLLPLVLIAYAAPVLADETPPAGAPKTSAGTSKATDNPPTASQPIEPPGSSDDLNAELAAMRPRHAGILENGPVSLIDPLFDDMNAKLDKSIGLKFGAAYTWALQHASDSATGGHGDAMSGDADLFARCRFFGEDDNAKNRGVLGVYGQYRHAFGDNPTPSELSGRYGGLWGTTNGFDRQEVMLTQAWWEQHLFKDELVVTVGKLDADNYYNKNRYQSDSTTFMSEAFSSNPARKHPGNGLGFNVISKAGRDFYVTAGAQDANGDKDKSGFHTIDEGDFFYAAEGGWTPTIEGMGKGAYRLTLWGINTADIAKTRADHGISVSCEQELCASYVPFFRAGWSDGDATGVNAFAAGGIGLEGVLRKGDLTGVGVAWGDPDRGIGRDQFGAEVFHRFQLAPDVQLTVGYQYIYDPSFAPSSNHDPIGVFEVRVRLEF